MEFRWVSSNSASINHRGHFSAFYSPANIPKLLGMKRLQKLLPALVWMLYGPLATAQTPNFSEDIAPLIYNNCSFCHHAAGIAPFTLTSFQDVFSAKNSIRYVLDNDIMPPWPPNPDFQHFANERVLDPAEKQAIIDWIDAGAPQGDPNLAPPAPVFAPGAVLGPPDAQVRMPVYTSNAVVQDDYICVALDLNIATTKRIRAVEVLPGNTEIVHHVLVYKDAPGTYVSDSIYLNCGGPVGSDLIGGYVPGSGPIQFPNGNQVKMGMTVNPGDQIILAMHFPMGSAGEVDSTAVNFYFYPDGVNGVREVFAEPIIQDWNFCVPAGQVVDVDVAYPAPSGLAADFSLLSVFPHSHLLGKSWKVYALDAIGDTIPLIHIPHWDFDWQGFYFFDYIKKLPAASRIYAKATYDNTTNNHHNPNNPPITVCAGLNTTDEMMLVYFHYLPYLPGDELINMDSLLHIPVGLAEAVPAGLAPRITPFPNPASGPLTLDYYVPRTGDVRLRAYDLQGRLVADIWHGQQDAGQYHLRWEPRLPAGSYVLELSGEGFRSSSKLLLR